MGEVIGKGQAGISGGAGNVLLLDLGGRYMVCSFWKNASSCTCMIYVLFSVCVILQ